jgi:plasmid stability protein
VSNLTLVIDDAVLRRARIRALEQGTSVNALVRHYLEAYAAGADERSARTRLLELSDRLEAGSGELGRSWRREELYEDRARGSS